MSRDEGFAVMDWSTSAHEDRKWKVIWRRRPDLIAPCAYVYQVLAASSWREGERLTVDDGWPPLLPYDAEVVAELVNARLLDAHRKVLIGTWRGWFEPAKRRRTLSRERNARANQNRHDRAMSSTNNSADTALQPRADTAVTLAPVRPSVPSDPSVPTDRVNKAVEVDDGARPNGHVDPSLLGVVR